MDSNQIKPILEAALFAANEPLSLDKLQTLFTESEAVAAEIILKALHDLQAEYAERGVILTEVASGFRFQVRTDIHPWITRLWTERQSKYSRALLETLALIAYRQPITRAEIEHIRGVVVSTHIIRTLEEREWIRVVGHRDMPGKPALFGTTKIFLDYFGLKNLDGLPALAEIKDLEEIRPQLELSATASEYQPPETSTHTEREHTQTKSTEATHLLLEEIDLALHTTKFMENSKTPMPPSNTTNPENSAQPTETKTETESASALTKQSQEALT